MRGDFIHVPLDQAQKPIEGHCYVNRYWLVHPEKGLAFYYSGRGDMDVTSPHPQCNKYESITRKLNHLLKDHDVVFVPVVFHTHAYLEMQKHAKLRKAELEASKKKSEVSHPEP